LINGGKGKFTVKHLPVEAQFAPVFGLAAEDINADGHVDIVMGGNFYRTKPETGRYDASVGLVLTGDGRGNFQVLHFTKSGWKIHGEVRDILPIRVGKKRFFIVARNNDKLLTFTLK
jgi:hypothetical protein